MNTSVTREKLVADCKVALADAQALLREMANQGGEEMDRTRERLGEAVQRARIRLEEAESALTERARTAVRSADARVRENPWQAVSAAAAVALVIGILIGRR